MSVDPDFWTDERVAELRTLAGQNRNDSELGRHFGVSRFAIEYARRNNKIATGWVHPGEKVMPANFADIAPTMTQVACAAHFKVSTAVVRRWYHNTGIEAAKRVYGTQQADTGSSPVARRIWRQSGYAPMAKPIQRDSSLPSQAQLFLQRFGPVFRASTINTNATGWIMFGRRVSDEDLINTAVRKGFQASMAA